jgi:methionyl-tRNA formyltransferase
MDDTARDLYFKYNAYGAGLFRKDIRRLIEKKYRFKPQSSEGSSYYSRKSLDFRNLNWEFARTAYQLHCQLRAFIFPEYQLPRVHGSYIIKSQITERRSLLEPGGVVSEDEASLEIATIDYNLKLYKKTDYA